MVSDESEALAPKENLGFFSDLGIQYLSFFLKMGCSYQLIFIDHLGILGVCILRNVPKKFTGIDTFIIHWIKDNFFPFMFSVHKDVLKAHSKLSFNEAWS
jgi:hypothetical protein